MVAIVAEPDSYKMKLVHNDVVGHVEMASRHLSYGEKNAFALVLFMYQVLSENPDIVILDDPISSFDRNKKFAIVHKLFRVQSSLRGKTSLMLTHDIEPVIDIIKISNQFQGSNPSATFLSSRSGVVSEVKINKDDIQTFGSICKDNLIGPGDPLIKAIYLRRHFELQDDMGLEYNLLASVFKGRDVPTVKVATGDREMTSDEKSKAVLGVLQHIAGFDYDKLVAEVKDRETIRLKFNATNVGYEKIQLFRIVDGEHDDDVIRKFINESYHIENEYVMQLNPNKFESIPEYVVDECARLI